MSSTTFVVIVEPHRWQRSTEELARLLEPLTGVSSPVLISLLSRGPVTVEADLTRLGAQNLLNRLNGLGIPGAIQGETDPTHQNVKPPKPHEFSFDALEALGVVDIEISDDLAIDHHFSPVRQPKPDARPSATTQPIVFEPDSEPEEDAARTVSGRPTAPEAADPTIRLGLSHSADRHLPAGNSPTAQTTRDSAPTSGGWGSLFPDLDPHPTAVLPPRPADAQLPASLFEEEPAPLSIEIPVVAPPPSVLTTPVSVKQPDNKTTVQPATPANETSPRPIADAFRRNEERAPYAPTGYDDRDPHLPLLARFLSAIAPGAGQIYNGDDDLALDYGFKFLLLKPWLASVRHAGRRAEKIRDFWLPWPKPGALGRAIRYAAGFWFVIVSVVGILTFVVTTAIQRQIPDDPGITDADRATAVRDANSRVVAARIAALDALAEVAQEERASEYIMTEAERAARIFTVGYAYCTQSDFLRCEALMKRAYTLNRAESRALRLQAWASVQARTPDGSKMPDVGPVETLSEFEMEQFRKEQQQEKP